MLLLAQLSFSQINTDNSSEDLPQSQLNLIENARALLIDAFIQNNKQKIQELYQYLYEDFDQDSYVTLFPAERMLLFAWCEDFKSMLQYVKKVDSAYVEKMNTKIMPSSDNNFYETLFFRTQKEFDTILSNLQTSFLTQEEKDFLDIYLHYFLLTDENYDTAVVPINTSTRKFIGTYPDSEYINFLDSYEQKLSDWGFGFGLNFGYNAKNGDFSKYLKDSFAFDMNIDVSYKKTMATVGLLLAFSPQRTEITNSENIVLPKDITPNITNIYLSFGYRLFENKKVIIMPNAGVGIGLILPGSDEDRNDIPELKQFDYSYRLTKNIGIMVDIRLGKIKKAEGQNFIEPSFGAIRIGYKFFNNYKSLTPEYYRGNLHTITVGYSFYGKTLKPVKYK